MLKKALASRSRESRTSPLLQGYHVQFLVALAWTILSSVYSENNDATIDALDPTQPQGIFCVHLHLDAEQLMKEVQGQLQQKLHEGNNGGKAETFEAVQEAVQIRSGLPKTLIVTEIDDVIHRFALERGYILVIDGQEGRSDDRFLVLRRYYNSSKLDSRDLQNILDRVGNLITQLSADRDQKMGAFNLMCASDEKQLGNWNRFMPPSLDACVHDLIELQSKQHPHNEAVCAWDGSFTYEELDRLATALAIKLVAVGVSLGSCVPLLFEKSKWHIVSLLAVLKAGAAFVALEHTIPGGRIQMILEQLDLVITVNEDTTSDDLSDVSLPVRGSGAGLQPDHPAYVIFTSGSTGTPKGVVIEHRQLYTSMQALNDKIAFTPDMRVFQMTAFNFDLSLSEIFCPLLGGGCICMPSEWTRSNDLAGAVDSLIANFGSFSPSFLATLSDKDFPKLKTILLAGERVPADLSSFWTSHGRRMMHMYGPTECTIGCCFLDANVHIHYIGFIGDSYSSKLWVVDPENHDKLMPVGAPGELLVEGPIVGRCDLGDPEKTRESFIECPSWFSTLLERQPSRFYKTGDLGRLTKTGGYEIVGRKDTQTKIRGLRMEIREIEHQIRMACGSKVGVAVEVRNPTSIPGQEMLVAFLEIKSQEQSPESSSLSILWEKLASSETLFSRTVDQVKMELPKLLPDYTIPSAYLPMWSLPFSNSYKLNRRALKERVNSLTILEIQKTLSSKERKDEDRRLTEKEVMLRSIWVEILHTAPETVGIYQDFFYSGGDSLKAMALVSAAHRRGIYFLVAQLYQYRTIAKLSQFAGVETYEDLQTESFSLIDNADVKQLQEIAAQQCGIQVESIQDIMPILNMQGILPKTSTAPTL